MEMYRPLLLDRPEFRLLRLHSLKSAEAAQRSPFSDLTFNVLDTGSEEGQLQKAEEISVYCDLYHSFRDENPHYEALSYAWGDPKQTVPIIVNGQSRQVTINLRNALQHIRRESEDVHLWVDALCINQSHAEEKGHQVGQMRGIYGEAANTIVWLGPASEDSDTTMMKLDKTGKLLVETGIRDKMIELGRLPSSSSEEYSSLEKDINDNLNDTYVTAMMDIPNVVDLVTGCQALSLRPYWNRVWIIQEFVVSSKLQIRCGTQTIPFEHFHGCLLFLPFLTINIIQRLHSYIVSVMETQDVTELAGQFMKLCNTMINQQANSISGMRLRSGYIDEADQGMNLIRLLAKVHIGVPSCATDDRDRIFGLLGMARDAAQLGIVPDYSEITSYIDVYTFAARKIIEAGNIDMLSFSQHRNHRTDIPSWVPDWTKQMLRPCGQLPWDSSYNISAGATFTSSSDSLRTPVGDNELKLPGYILDIVERLAPESWCPGPEGVNKDHPHLPGYLEGILKLCELSDEQLRSGIQAKDPYLNPDDRTTAYLRVPVADMEQYGIGFVRRSLSDPKNGNIFPGLLKGYEGVLKEIQTGKSGGDSGIQSSEVSGFFNMLGWQTYRRAILLKCGLVGLGPARVETGDVVVIFQGARFPYVLRQHDDIGLVRKWTLIGEAYVHGIMYGEVFRDTSNVHNLKFEEFVIS